MFHNCYRRADGVEGVGYLIQFAGRPCHSIAWPDAQGERVPPDMLEHKKITLLESCEGECERLCECDHVEIELTEELPADEQVAPSPVVDEPTAEVSEGEPAEVVEEAATEGPAVTEAQSIRAYLEAHPDADNATVVAALKEGGVDVTTSQVNRQRKKLKG